jgi:16S rRNA (cytidine1402-2'-O)-methyltransferase
VTEPRSARPPALVVVATPIGNLEDLSLRAARVLRSAVMICAEDTRTARQLLRHVEALGSGAPASERRIISLFDGNEQARAAEVCEAIAGGTSVALISEAGMPGVSDPGQRLVAAVVAAGLPVEVVPGPVAAIHALVASGLPTDTFLFLGFPPREPGARQVLFGARRAERATMVLYEAPDRVGATCRPGGRVWRRPPRLRVARAHQAVRGARARLAGELAARYADVPPRGECCVVVGGVVGRWRRCGRPGRRRGRARALLASGLGPRTRRRAWWCGRASRGGSCTSWRCRCSVAIAMAATGGMSPIAVQFDRPAVSAGTRRRAAAAGLRSRGGAPHASRPRPTVAVHVGYRVGSSDEAPAAPGGPPVRAPVQELAAPGRAPPLRAPARGRRRAPTPDRHRRTVYHEVVPPAALALALWLESDRMGYFLPASTRYACAQADRRGARRAAPALRERGPTAASASPLPRRCTPRATRCAT